MVSILCSSYMITTPYFLLWERIEREHVFDLYETEKYRIDWEIYTVGLHMMWERDYYILAKNS